MTLQEIIAQVENLSMEDRDYLLELIRQQQIDNHQPVIANCLEEEKTNSEGFWDLTLRFRKRMEQENIIFTDEDFLDLRDRSVGREVKF
jgi:hypothetical protein